MPPERNRHCMDASQKATPNLAPGTVVTMASWMSSTVFTKWDCPRMRFRLVRVLDLDGLQFHTRLLAWLVLSIRQMYMIWPRMGMRPWSLRREPARRETCPKTQHRTETWRYSSPAGPSACVPWKKSGFVAPSGDFDQVMAELAPYLGGVALRPVHWADIPSPHLTPEDMFRLARDVETALAEPSTLGAIVVHGTDALEESAFMADLVMDTVKPVIFTGSMRYYTESGYDGIRNLINAVKACTLPMPPESGVAVLMADRFYSAKRATKINSLNVGAFAAYESGPLGYVAGEDIVLMHQPQAPLCPVQRRVFKTEAVAPGVPLVKAYTGMDDSQIRLFQERGALGLVVEGFGAGNLPATLLPVLDELVRDNVPVVLTTRCPEGGVWPVYGYPGGGADLKKRGLILGRKLPAPKARLLLTVLLGMGRGSGTRSGTKWRASADCRMDAGALPLDPHIERKPN